MHRHVFVSSLYLKDEGLEGRHTKKGVRLQRVQTTHTLISPLLSTTERKMMTKPIIRTITAFVNFHPNDFESTCPGKIENVKRILQGMESSLQNEGYTVQTVRVATNPFGEWVFDEEDVTEEGGDKSKRIKREKMERLTQLDNLLSQSNIEFCSLGPAKSFYDASLCSDIISKSHRFSCSIDVPPGSVVNADLVADTIIAI